MTELQDERRLFREATDLAIRLQNDPANSVSVDMVRTWAARSPAHAEAWARVAEIHGMTGKILSDQRQAREGGRLSRRSLLIGGTIGLGAVGAGSLTLPRALLRMRADHITSTAEIRRIDLSDGSVMTLGPDSAVAMDYSNVRRTIELLAGMAYFEVADDTGRPFSVLSGPATATALGTAFEVSNDAGYIFVSVEHGTVEARVANAQVNHQNERLADGEWITIDPSAGYLARGKREASQIAAWRGGMIVAESETVAAMVAKISRWLPGRVVIADPFLGAREVSGVFDLRDPARALEAVVRPFDARVRTIGPLMTVISPV
jgi:transmembrane sensor